MSPSNSLRDGSTTLRAGLCRVASMFPRVTETRQPVPQARTIDSSLPRKPWQPFRLTGAFFLWGKIGICLVRHSCDHSTVKLFTFLYTSAKPNPRHQWFKCCYLLTAKKQKNQVSGPLGSLAISVGPKPIPAGLGPSLLQIPSRCPPPQRFNPCQSYSKEHQCRTSVWNRSRTCFDQEFCAPN
jgi:hypothetical protein